MSASALQEPPKVASGASQQETTNRGGAASTSTSTESLPDLIGNEHTAKWKVYTTLAKKLVAQVTKILCSSTDAIAFMQLTI